MHTVQRTKGVRKAIRTRMMNRPAQRFVTAGDSACRRMMLEARQRRIPGPSDSAILAWAKYDLQCELLGGFWQRSAA